MFFICKNFIFFVILLNYLFKNKGNNILFNNNYYLYRSLLLSEKTKKEADNSASFLNRGTRIIHCCKRYPS